MDFKAFSQKFADQSGGQYQDYDDNQSIFVVPLKGDRYQTVICRIVLDEKTNRKTVQVTSRVCPISAEIDYKAVLEASADFTFTNFIVENDFLKVDTTIFFDNADEELITEAIYEVANTADHWELEITGQDIF